jgi:hypothetical protein
MPPELELLRCCHGCAGTRGVRIKKAEERAPTTLAADESSGGLGVKMTFERVHREIEGVTPKQLPAPASHTLPNSDPPASDTSDINNLDG